MQQIVLPKYNSNLEKQLIKLSSKKESEEGQTFFV